MGKKGKSHGIQPKKPPNPFLLFCAEERKKMGSELACLPFSEVSKELSKKWKELSADEKRVYEEQNRQIKANYDAELKKLKYVKLPTSRPNGFLEFSKFERPKIVASNGDLSVPEIAKELGFRWRALSEDERNKYHLKSKSNSAKQKDSLMVNSCAVIAVAGDSVSGEERSLENNESEEMVVNSVIEVTDGDDVLSGSGPTITAENLGFAKQRFYPWHPAMRTGDFAKGTRVKVTYFGTGETGVVDRDKWIKFSEESESKVCTPGLMRKVSFLKGLDQLKGMLQKVLQSSVASTPVSDLGISEQPRGRKLVKLSKDGLQRDEDQNLRLMKDKIVEIDEGLLKWGCRECTWKGKYHHQAKAHARDCGNRRRENKRKNACDRYECSAPVCSLTFATKKKLRNHYR